MAVGIEPRGDCLETGFDRCGWAFQRVVGCVVRLGAAEDQERREKNGVRLFGLCFVFIWSFNCFGEENSFNKILSNKKHRIMAFRQPGGQTGRPDC
jgi:hypothetical protein